MKNKLWIVLFVIMLFSGCSTPSDKIFGVFNSFAAGPLLVTSVTPTNVMIVHDTGKVSIPITASVVNADGDNLKAKLSIYNGGAIARTIEGTGLNIFNNVDFTINVKVDTTGMSASTGTYELIVTTATATSNVVRGAWVIQ